MVFLCPHVLGLFHWCTALRCLLRGPNLGILVSCISVPLCRVSFTGVLHSVGLCRMALIWAFCVSVLCDYGVFFVPCQSCVCAEKREGGVPRDITCPKNLSYNVLGP